MLPVFLCVEADGFDGRHDDHHAERDWDEEHDDMFRTVLQRQFLVLDILYGFVGDLPRVCRVGTNGSALRGRNTGQMIITLSHTFTVHTEACYNTHTRYNIY